MGDITISKFNGIHQTNNDLSQVPEGAATDCENVVIQKYGLLEPRRGFNFVDIGTAPTQWNADNARKITNHYQSPDFGTDYFIRENSPPAIYNSATLVAASLQNGSYPTLFPINQVRPKMEFYNGCTYLLASLTNGGKYGSVYEFNTANKNRPFLRRAGVPAPASVTTNDVSGGTAWAVGTSTVYVALFTYLNQGGAIIKSAPSTLCQHKIGTINSSVNVSVRWSTTAFASDLEDGRVVLQVYRSSLGGADVYGVDYRLLKEVTLTSSELGSGSYSFVDKAADSTRGEELYINEAVGIEPKLMAPSAADMTIFKDRAWVAAPIDDQPETTFTLAGTQNAATATLITIPGSMGITKTTATLNADGILYFGMANGHVYSYDGTTVTLISAATGVAGGNTTVYSLVKVNGDLYALAAGGTASAFYKYAGTGTTWALANIAGIPSSTSYPQWHSLQQIGSWVYWIQQASNNIGTSGLRHRVSGWNPSTGAIAGPWEISSTGTVLVTTECMTVAPRNKVDPTAPTDTTKVLVVGYRQDDKPTISWVNPSVGTFTQLYQGIVDITLSKYRTYYSNARGELFSFAEFSSLGKPADVWRVNSNGSIDQSASTAQPTNGDSGCFWMGDLNGSHHYGAIKGISSSYVKLNSVKSTAAHNATPDVVFDGTADTAAEVRAAWLNGDVIIITYTAGGNTILKKLTKGGLELNDQVIIGGQTYTASTTETSSTFILTVNGTSVGVVATAKSLVDVINRFNANVSASLISTQPGQILLKAKNATGASGIYSNKTSVWSPNATRAFPAGVVGSQIFNQLRYSEIYEPGAWPLANERFVGAPEDKILRIKSTKDSLFIIKQNSVWVIRGESLTPILLDDTISCIAADSVAKLNNQIYFLCNKGIAVCSDSGVSIEGQQISSMFDKGNTTFSDAYGFGVEKYNSYYFIMKDPTDSYYRKAFVYNTVTQTVTKQKFDSEIASGSVVYLNDESTGKSPKIVFHPYATGVSDSFSYKLELRESYSTNATFWDTDFIDSSFSHAPWGYAGGAYQINGVVRNTYPKVGDFVTRIPNIRQGKVTSVGSFGASTSFVVTWNGVADDGVYTGQTFSFERPIESSYTFTPQFFGAPQTQKHFQNVELNWQAQPTENAAIDYISDIPSVAVSATATITGTGSPVEGKRAKSFTRVPRNAARANSLVMKVKVPTTTHWSLASVTISAEGGTEK